MDFQRVKQSVRMEEVLAAYSIHIQRGGWAICPFHDDRKPSLKVYDHGYYCFACGAGGDVINFVANMEHIQPIQAAAKLMADHGITAEPSADIVRRRREKARQAAIQAKAAEAREILSAARRQDGGKASEWDYWLDELEDDPEGFLRDNREVIERAGQYRGIADDEPGCPDGG